MTFPLVTIDKNSNFFLTDAITSKNIKIRSRRKHINKRRILHTQLLPGSGHLKLKVKTYTGNARTYIPADIR